MRMVDIATALIINERIDRLDGKSDGWFEFRSLQHAETGTSQCVDKEGMTPRCDDFYQALDQVSALAAKTPTGQAKISMSYQNTGTDFKPRRQYEVSPSGSHDEMYAYAICIALLRWYIMDDKDIGTSIQKIMEDPRSTGSRSAINDAMAGMPVYFESGFSSHTNPIIGTFTNELFTRLSAQYSMNLSAFMVST